MLFDRVDFLLKLVVARNDPMEGLYRSSTRVLESPGYNQVVHNILDSTSHIGICCLSEPQESELMWVKETCFRRVWIKVSCHPFNAKSPANNRKRNCKITSVLLGQLSPQF